MEKGGLHEHSKTSKMFYLVIVFQQFTKTSEPYFFPELLNEDGSTFN